VLSLFQFQHADIICKDTRGGVSSEKPEVKSVSAQVDIVSGTIPSLEQEDIPLIDKSSDDEEEESKIQQNGTVVEEVVYQTTTANNLEGRVQLEPHLNGANVNEPNGAHCIAPIVEVDENNEVPNGTLGPKKKKSKKKSKKEKVEKTPKKSPRKLLAIVPSTTDEEMEDADREKRHQAALMTVRPKCCTIS